MFYVVFARINDIKEMPSDRVAGSILLLEQIGEKVNSENPEIRTYSSVYGRFWVVPKSVRKALATAASVLDMAAEAGIGLGIGVTVGRLEVTEDLLEENVAGIAINHAARLAFMDANQCRIAVDEEVVGYAIDAGRPFSTESFGGQESGKVKLTQLRFRWLKRLTPQLGEAPFSETDDLLAHIVVYDIVQFSQMEQRDLVQSVEDLRHAVRRSLESTGLARWADVDELAYAPAGDGGVIVFGPERGRAAWSFVKALLAHTADRVSVRLGIATGIVIVVGKNLPVGKGVIRADFLSGLAEVGHPCVSSQFWRSLDNHEKEGWSTTSVPEDVDCLRIQSPNFR